MNERFAGEVWGRSWHETRRFLRRWSDTFTAASRDDLAADAVLETWLRQDHIAEPARVGAYARTIARRLRARRMDQHVRLPMLPLETEHAELLAAPDPADEVHFRVLGEAVSSGWLWEQVEQLLASGPPLSGTLLLAYHGGASCRDLARSTALSVEAVKMRLHRTRHRLRRVLEERVRTRVLPRADAR